jgi:hypothetical protein
MSFRTDGFEPSAYTIPPPRPRAKKSTSPANARELDHSAIAIA